MHTRPTILTFALPLTLAFGVPAYAQQPTGAAAAIAAFGMKLKSSPPNGCAKNWIIDGQKGLALLHERALARNQQLLALTSALPPAPKDKRLSRAEYDSATATAAKLKAIEMQMQCDGANRHAFAKEKLGWDKAKETDAVRAQNDAAENQALMEAEKIRRDILAKLQQMLAAQNETAGGAAK